MKTSFRIVSISIVTIVYLLSHTLLVFAEGDDDRSVWDKRNGQVDAPNTSKEEEVINEEEGESQTTTEVAQGSDSLFLDFIKMIIALIFVLALIYFLLKFIQKRSRIYQQSRSLENIGGLSLGSNKSVQIIRVGNQYYLLGVGEDVQLLTEIEDSNTIEDITSYNTSDQEPLSFQRVMDQFKKRNQNPYQEQETKRQFQTELQSMKNTRERLMKRYRNRNEDRHD